MLILIQAIFATPVIQTLGVCFANPVDPIVNVKTQVKTQVKAQASSLVEEIAQVLFLELVVPRRRCRSGVYEAVSCAC